MRNLLLVSYHHPPSPAVGAVRTGALAKHLPRLGWNVIPVGVGQDMYNPAFEVLKTLLRVNNRGNLRSQISDVGAKIPYGSKFIMAVAKRYGERFAFPDAYHRWIPEAIESGVAVINNRQVDMILSSGPPVSAHIVGRQLSNSFGIPWVADMRDLWSQNHCYPYSEKRRIRDQELEQEVLSDARAIVTASPYLASQQRNMHQKTCVSIVNGFEPQPNVEKLDDTFSIVYTGNIYEGKQSASALFQSLRSTGIPADVSFYGAKLKETTCGVPVRTHPFVEREIALLCQRQAQILLLLKWQDINQRGVYSAKLWEYLGAKRPILAIGGHPDVVDELLDETGAGVCCKSEEEVTKVLGVWYEAWKETGSVPYHGNDQVENYTHRQMAEKFSSLLDEISKKGI